MLSTTRLTIFLGAAALSALSWAPAVVAQQAEAEVVIRLGHVAPANNPYHWASEHFAAKVAEYTDGAVEVRVFPGAQLGGDRDLLEGVQLGSLDAGYISLAVFEGLSPVLTGFQMPFLIDDYETAFTAQTSEIANRALAEFEDFNIKGLAIVENGMRVPGNTVRPIRTPEDFQGIAFRAPEAPLQLSMFSMLGASVTPMPFPEIFTALQTGVLDGQDQYLNTWIGQGAYEVVDYMSLTQMYTWPAVISINLSLFESLSPEQRDALERAAAEAQEYAYGRLVQTDAEAIEVLKKAGIQIEEDIDLGPFEAILEPLYETYASQHPIVDETIRFIRSSKSE